MTCGVAAGCLVTASTVPYARCPRSEGLLALREHPGAACQYPMAGIPGLRLLLIRVQTDAYLHFGFQPSVTQDHLPSLTRQQICPKWLLWMTVNPRVGDSIPPLATIRARC